MDIWTTILTLRIPSGISSYKPPNMYSICSCIVFATNLQSIGWDFEFAGRTILTLREGRRYPFDTSGRLCSHRKIEWIDFEYFQIRHYLLCIYIPTCFALHSWTLNYSTFPISSGKHKPRLRKMSSHIKCFHPSCRDFPFLSKIKKVAQKPHEYAHLSLSRMTP